MSPYFLLLLSLFPLIFAFPASLPSPRHPVRQEESPSENIDCSTNGPNCIRTVILKDGIATIGVAAFFQLTGTDRSEASDPSYEIDDGKDDNIITDVDFGPPNPPIPDNDNIVYPTTITFNGFPGRVTMRIFLTDGKGVLRSRTYIFEVVGLVLYEEQGDEPHILTGRNPSNINVQALDGGAFGATVKVRSFEGSLPSALSFDQLRLVVPEYGDVLPWNPEDCPIRDDIVTLNARCAMVFSVDLTTFSVRIAPGKEVPDIIRVQFEWVGIRAFQNAENGESGVSSDEEPISLTDDIITSALINKQIGSNGNRLTASASLAGWKIGVIAITSVLLVIAAITVVCCFFCGKKRSHKKPEPDVVGFKDKFQEIGFLRRVSTLRRGDNDLENDDQCYVEEPPTPIDSEILMLENESRGNRRSAEGHMEGLIPMNRLTEDEKSVERLVLRPGVVRGVELESSTEGASGFGYGSPSGENDVTSYGRGMTSVPRDQFTKPREYGSSRDRSSMASRRSDLERSRDPDYFRDPDYLRDSHERIRSLERDRARIRELDREIERERAARERSEERMRPRSSVEEFPDSGPAIDDRTNGVMSKSRGGVGAAINRIRQLDLLNGPASRGLVGRNGEPIQRNDDEDGLGREVGDIPQSIGS